MNAPSFLNTAREILAPECGKVTRTEIQMLAGMPYGRRLDQAELSVTEAWCSYRSARRKAREGRAGRFDLTPEATRAQVRLAIAKLRALKGQIVASYGRHLPQVRRGVMLDRRV